jgi:hypothetical protein
MPPKRTTSSGPSRPRTRAAPQPAFEPEPEPEPPRGLLQRLYNSTTVSSPQRGSSAAAATATPPTPLARALPPTVAGMVDTSPPSTASGLVPARLLDDAHDAAAQALRAAAARRAMLSAAALTSVGAGFEGGGNDREASQALPHEGADQAGAEEVAPTPDGDGAGDGTSSSSSEEDIGAPIALEPQQLDPQAGAIDPTLQHAPLRQQQLGGGGTSNGGGGSAAAVEAVRAAAAARRAALAAPSTAAAEAAAPAPQSIGGSPGAIASPPASGNVDAHIRSNVEYRLALSGPPSIDTKALDARLAAWKKRQAAKTSTNAAKLPQRRTQHGGQLPWGEFLPRADPHALRKRFADNKARITALLDVSSSTQQQKSRPIKRTTPIKRSV